MATLVADPRSVPPVIDQLVLQLMLLQLLAISRHSMVLRSMIVPLQALQVPILL